MSRGTKERLRLFDQLVLVIDRKTSEVVVVWADGAIVGKTTVADAIRGLENAACVVRAMGVLESD